MDLLTRFENVLLREHALESGKKIAVACSGGPDSTALFYCLTELKQKYSLKLFLLHFNHRLRGVASDRDEQFVRELARRFKVKIFVGKGSVKKWAKRDAESLEEAARKARYHFFVKTATPRKILRIALGHTRDDQAETILMRILQGTGIRGLSGIRPAIQSGKTTLFRPFLGFSKQEILDYLRLNKIRYCLDASNRSTRFLRNRVRRKLLPQLVREFNPRLVEALARIPSILRQENEILSELEEAAWKRVLKAKRRKKIYLHRDRFLKFPAALQFRLLDRAAKRLDVRSGIRFDLWQELRQHLARKRFRFSLPRDIDFSLSPVRLVLYKK